MKISKNAVWRWAHTRLIEKTDKVTRLYRSARYLDRSKYNGDGTLKPAFKSGTVETTEPPNGQ